MSELLGVRGTEFNGMPEWLIMVLAVITGVLIVVLALIFCIRSQFFCFDR